MNSDTRNPNSLLVCRICLTILKEQYFELTSTTFQEKSLKELMEIIGQITVESLNLTRYLCAQCCDNLCKFHVFRNQIQQVEKNLREKCLTLIEIDGQTKYCFTEKKVQVDKLMVVTDSANGNKTDLIIKDVKVQGEVTLNGPDDVTMEEGKLENVGTNRKKRKRINTEFDNIVANAVKMDQSKRGVVYPCEFCERKYTKMRDLQLHYKHQHKDEKPTFACDECDGKIYRSGPLLKNHKVAVHSNIKPFACTHCDLTFRFASQLRNHLAKVNGIKLYDDTTNKRKKPNCHVKLMECPICKKVMRGSSQYGAHMRRHAGNKYPCDICNRMFWYRTQVKVHKQTAHSQQRTFLCDVCGKGFFLKWHLQTHALTHITEKPYMCEICSQQFKTSSSLQSHQLKHTARETGQIACETSLKRTCKLCNKQVSPKYYRYHLQTHGPPNIACDICGQEFKLQNTLYEHKRKVHMEISKQKGQCDICGLWFATRTTCLNHKMNVHMGVYIKEKCTLCGKMFSKGGLAKKHVTKKHPERIDDYRSVITKVKVRRVKDGLENGHPEDDVSCSDIS